MKLLKNITDSRIRVIANEKNIGLTKSLNRGLSLAKGDYIARMDADDISDPQRLEKNEISQQISGNCPAGYE
ncbi:glycosyltransferase family 2 protein [Methanoregula sp.]|uniref:glycosyltransferase family 2 protein n=1 Tax=Methanoregula sp. TaxID=2052170 RepID=UPI003C74BB51